MAPPEARLERDWQGARSARLLAAFLCTACATSQVDVEGAASIAPERPVILLPFINASDAPLAGERTEAIVTTLLRQKGVETLLVHGIEEDPDRPPEIDDWRRYQRALVAARDLGVGYGVTGTIVEWGYRPGLDDLPAVSISLRVVDVKDGRVLWSGSGARGDRGTLGALAQSLLRELTEAMPLGAR